MQFLPKNCHFSNAMISPTSRFGETLTLSLGLAQTMTMPIWSWNEATLWTLVIQVNRTDWKTEDLSYVER